ncbi:efflux RND transporter periplasmic adaptor subunit [Chitinasiproducens palmae]|uniref:efflux RND transporter periplasmic adaptor subunit n=1 Tax=Chitinasiproducens palmae TaxID=1770053 RepID=UPI000B80AF1D
MRLGATAVALLALGALAVALRPRIEYTTQAVGRGDIEATVLAVGTLQPAAYVDVGAQVSGQIMRLYVRPGSEVRRGQALVEIDPSVQQATVDAGRAGLAALRAQLDEQRAQSRLAAQQDARQRALAAAGATRDEDVESAAASAAAARARIANLAALIAQTQANMRADEARLGYTRIYAPMAGTVVSVEAREGQTLNATYQTPNILRIADLSVMTVWTEVSEADVRRVRAGMPVYFTTLGDDTRRWQGTVRQILPAPPVPENKGTTAAATPPANKVVLYTVLFDVHNADHALMPQMTAQVSFVSAAAHKVLVAPRSALTAVADSPDRFTARVLGAHGEVELRTVRVGVGNRIAVEVLDGLRQGERLVTGERRVGGLKGRFRL